MESQAGGARKARRLFGGCSRAASVAGTETGLPGPGGEGSGDGATVMTFTEIRKAPVVISASKRNGSVPVEAWSRSA